jgi:flagellar assembly protein FliH
MSGLIRDARFAGSPLVLTRAGATVQPLKAESSMPAPEIRELPVNAEPRMTYAEFEQSLGERLDAMMEEARAQGLEEGRAQGLAEVEAAQAEQLEAMATFIRDARGSLEKDVLGVADLASEIVYEAVIKILGQASLSPEGASTVVREIVQRAKDRSRLLVRVRRTDLEWIRRHQERVLDGLDAGRVEFVADDRVILGGCILETPTGNLDGRLETQLAGLRDLLLTARLHPESEP